MAKNNIKSRHQNSRELGKRTLVAEGWAGVGVGRKGCGAGDGSRYV